MASAPDLEVRLRVDPSLTAVVDCLAFLEGELDRLGYAWPEPARAHLDAAARTLESCLDVAPATGG